MAPATGRHVSPLVEAIKRRSLAPFSTAASSNQYGLHPPPSSSQLRLSAQQQASERATQPTAVSLRANPSSRRHKPSSFRQKSARNERETRPHSLLRRPRTSLSRRRTSCVCCVVSRPPFQWSPRCYGSLGFVLFFFFLTGSWKARDCQTTWCTAGPIGAELSPKRRHTYTHTHTGALRFSIFFTTDKNDLGHQFHKGCSSWSRCSAVTETQSSSEIK